ncbi:MAG: flagellar assembly protein FliH [Spirochaetes bacterium]|nr:flagellar assembly protein FliH [Spirochaetota bacterium]
MPERVFKSENIVKLTKKVRIDPPRYKTKEEVESEQRATETYQGPSIEDIENEIAKLRSDWENELRTMKRNASDEAERIVDNAKTQAFEIYKAKQNDGRTLIEQTKIEANGILASAKDEADTIKKEAETVRDTAQREGYQKGYEEGFNKAFEEGKIEIQRMISKLEKILGETINKRNEIIDNSETQLIEIAILIAKRVVKMITERDKGVVVRNIQEALRKVKGRAKVTIRVNIDDLEIAARHKDEFYQMLDKIEGVTVLEDPNVDVGGCIIETDFGDIDARISTQMNEIETAIKEIEPVKGL